jgi:hypothetical protein
MGDAISAGCKSAEEGWWCPVTQRELQYVRPWMYDKQRDAIFARERIAVIEAST